VNRLKETLAIAFPELGAHPHIHGEYSPVENRAVIDDGSPPHTWGIQPTTKLRILTSRFTPTYMGNTGVFEVGK